MLENVHTLTPEDRDRIREEIRKELIEEIRNNRDEIRPWDILNHKIATNLRTNGLSRNTYRPIISAMLRDMFDVRRVSQLTAEQAKRADLLIDDFFALIESYKYLPNMKSTSIDTETEVAVEDDDESQHAPE